MNIKNKTQIMVSVAMLSAISYLLAFIELPALIATFGTFIPFIKTKLDVVLWNAVPFNLLKGIALSAITMLIYKPLTPILKGHTQHDNKRISIIPQK